MILCLVVLEDVRGVALVPEPEIVNEGNAALPVAVERFPGIGLWTSFCLPTKFQKKYLQYIQFIW